MDGNALKRAVERIELPQAAGERIIGACAAGAARPGGRTTVRKWVLTAAALCVLACVTAVGAAAAAGYFTDVTRWDGAVTGTVYEQAEEELAVTAAAGEGELLVTVTVLRPEEFPYRACEQLGIGDYRIADETGAVVLEGTGDGAAPVIDGTLELALPLDGMEEGGYTLVIDGFVAYARAEQPLPIGGMWECPFTL